MESKHTSADSPQAGTYGQEVTDRETSDLRRFRQGDGEIMTSRRSGPAGLRVCRVWSCV